MVGHRNGTASDKERQATIRKLTCLPKISDVRSVLLMCASVIDIWCLTRYARGMRPQGSPEELERRRRRGIELLKAGASVTEVARRLGCSHSSVILWREAVRRRGLKALTAKPAPGRPSKLTAAQQRQLPRLLLRGATTWKFDTDLWTTGRIATVIHRTFGVRLHRAHVGRLLTTLGWSCQKPERRALERDEAAIARWKRYRWVAVKKTRSA